MKDIRIAYEEILKELKDEIPKILADIEILESEKVNTVARCRIYDNIARNTSGSHVERYEKLSEEYNDKKEEIDKKIKSARRKIEDCKMEIEVINKFLM